MPIDRSLLQDYFSGKRKHAFYDQSVKMAEAFLPHSDGIYPGDLIDERRPNEPLEVKEYRKKVWKPKTKPTFGRILSSLGKIRRSSDWSVTYPKDDFPRIRVGEELYEYCEVKFPYDESVTNWVFSLLLKEQLTDPNAVCIVLPLVRDVAETDYKRPYPLIFGSVDVVEYVEGDWALLNNPNGVLYYSERGRVAKQGKSFYYADAFTIEKWNQVNAKGDFSMEWEYLHGLGEVPFFRLYGISIQSSETQRLNASRIGDILPSLDEAVREYSDLQAGKVLNMYPERWEYVQNECPSCKGLGRVANPHSTDDHPLPNVPCSAPGCTNGYVASGPYSKILIRPSNAAMEGGAAPTPPAGYVEKDIAILNLMTESVKQHIYDGLAAINFQFLEQTPLNQSGTAKEVDKDELNNTVHAIAEDLVRVMDRVYKLIALYRYISLYPNRDDIMKMLPSIPVPERFDILSANYLGDELDKAKKSKFDPSIVNALEIDYASKKFNAQHEVKDFLALVLGLDPLSNISEDDKISRLSNKGIRQIDYVVSSNIQVFVKRAIEADEEFPSKPTVEQRSILEAMAAEIIASTAAVIIPDDVEDEGQDNDIIGKVPLAVQQLSLAASRASESGNTELAQTITNKINALLGQVVEVAENDL